MDLFLPLLYLSSLPPAKQLAITSNYFYLQGDYLVKHTSVKSPYVNQRVPLYYVLNF